MQRRDRPGRVRDGLERFIPTWVLRHPTWSGVIWAIVFAILIGVAELADWPGWAWIIVFLLLVAPALLATIIVLSSTPRSHLNTFGSVFGHFFTRYLVLVVGFLAWTTSVVLGAAISTSLQLAAENREDEVMGIGIELVARIAPNVIVLLWIAFILRCAWFLSRLRGWRELPTHTEVPESFFRRNPSLRSLALGLAHPGLLLVTGVISGAGILIVDVAMFVMEFE